MGWGRGDPLWFSLPAWDNDVGRRRPARGEKKEFGKKPSREEGTKAKRRTPPFHPSPGAPGGQSAARPRSPRPMGRRRGARPKVISARGWRKVKVGRQPRATLLGPEPRPRSQVAQSTGCSGLRSRGPGRRGRPRRPSRSPPSSSRTSCGTARAAGSPGPRLCPATSGRSRRALSRSPRRGAAVQTSSRTRRAPGLAPRPGRPSRQRRRSQVNPGGPGGRAGPGRDPQRANWPAGWAGVRTGPRRTFRSSGCCGDAGPAATERRDLTVSCRGCASSEINPELQRSGCEGCRHRPDSSLDAPGSGLRAPRALEPRA